MGSLVGRAIVEATAWEWIFWINVPIGLAPIPPVLNKIAESFGDIGLDLPDLGLMVELITAAPASARRSTWRARARPACAI